MSREAHGSGLPGSGVRFEDVFTRLTREAGAEPDRRSGAEPDLMDGLRRGARALEAQPKSAKAQALAALKAATQPLNPGPALLVLPIERGAADALPCRVSVGPVTVKAPAHEADVLEAASMLARAERPLIVIGGGCRPHVRALRRLVDALDVPF